MTNPWDETKCTKGSLFYFWLTSTSRSPLQLARELGDLLPGDRVLIKTRRVATLLPQPLVCIIQVVVGVSTEEKGVPLGASNSW